MTPSIPIAVVLCALSVSPVFAADLVLLGSSKKIVQLEDVSLTEAQRRAYIDFVNRADYFGALAVSETSDTWGSLVSSSLQHSEVAALEQCNTYTEQKDCRIITVVLPVGASPTDRQTTVLTPGQQKYVWKEYLQGSVQNARHYAALAGNSVYVVARYGRSVRDRAISDALSDCRRYSSGLRETLGSQMHNVLEKIGALTCRVLDVTEPKQGS